MTLIDCSIRRREPTARASGSNPFISSTRIEVSDGEEDSFDSTHYPRLPMLSLRMALTLYLNNATHVHHAIAPDAPRATTYDELVQANFPVVCKEEYQNRMARKDIWERRRRCHGLVTASGWKWEDLPRGSLHSKLVEVHGSRCFGILRTTSSRYDEKAA